MPIPRVAVHELEAAFRWVVAEYRFSIQVSDIKEAVKDYIALSAIGEMQETSMVVN